ncbi:hypothetical protein [Sphingobacterium sp. LRF_L2]|uniref:hypothetical protein n=1 Tax=Sphingobacterium sp. LRF_L2 TaxID=3369421 RepID=UPI003F619A47
MYKSKHTAEKSNILFLDFLTLRKFRVFRHAVILVYLFMALINGTFRAQYVDEDFYLRFCSYLMLVSLFYFNMYYRAQYPV